MIPNVKSRILRRRLPVGLLLATTLFAQSRDLRFDHISIEQGLSHLSVGPIVQDLQGFLWFGAGVGLNKYDGHNFTVYKHDPADSNSLPNNTIKALAIDQQGRLWIGTDHGLSCLLPHFKRFRNFLHDPENPRSLSHNVINTLCIDRQNRLWIGTAGGLNRYDEKVNAFIHFRHDPRNATSLSSDVVTSIYEDRRRVLWVGTNAGLNRCDSTASAFVRYEHYTKNPMEPQANFINDILEDRRGVMWVGASSGLYRYERATDRLTLFEDHQKGTTPIGRDHVFALHEDDRGDLWIGTFHVGLWRYEAATARLSQYLHDPKNPFTLAENRVNNIYQDHSGILWVATFRSGLNRHDPGTAAFQHFKLDHSVYAICEDRHGELWLGAERGNIYRFNRARTSFRIYQSDPQHPETAPADYVQALYEDRQGRLWMGAASGLRRFDRERDRFVTYYFESERGELTEHADIKTIFEDRSGEIWLGSKAFGLCRLEHERNVYRHDVTTPEVLQRTGTSDTARPEVWAVTEDRHGNLWVGTFGLGIVCLERSTGQHMHYPPEPTKAGHLLAGGIYSIYADSSGDLWIGTYGEGLSHFDARAKTFTHYREREGLPDTFVKAVLPNNADFHLKDSKEERGDLWLSTDKGLARFHPQTQTVKTYTVNEGLFNNTFLSGAYHKARDGRMFFGGVRGAVEFHPDSLKDNRNVPPIVITNFKVFDQPLPPRARVSNREIAIQAKPRIVLQYVDNFFSFEFVALDFKAPEKNQYAYKLEGFDRDWVQAGTRRYANYTNVAPGEYVFRVRGSNNDGVWNETTAEVVILPPFWQTWWFRISTIFVVAGALFYWHKSRTRGLEEKKKVLEQQVQERTAFADALQHALTEVENLKNRLEAENTYLQDEIKLEHNFADIISRSESLKKVLRKIEQVAATDATVLLLGESGTGKELLARAVHNLSNRRERPLVKVNCAVLPTALIESELFGHEKGAFTGAIARRIGRFELADHGTIFLDEIGELPLELQAKLLRVLQEGEFERLGGQQTLKVDTRIIAATNRNLKEEIAGGKFREDLYYRLNVFPITIPPLRERKEDIPLLVNHFIKKHAAKAGKKIETVSQQVIDTLQQYSWPGNVRELENVIERAVIVSSGKQLKLEEGPPREPRGDGKPESSSILTLEEIEKRHILEVLEKTGWRISGERGAAKLLNLNASTLRSRMEKLGIKR